MSLLISALTMGITTLICCPIIRQYCQENVQPEEIKNIDGASKEEQRSQELQEHVSSEQTVPKKPPRTFKQSCEKGESAGICKLKRGSPILEFVKNDPISNDGNRISKNQLVDQTTKVIINYLESCENTDLHAVTVTFQSRNSLLTMNNKVQKQIPISGTNIDSLKSISRISSIANKVITTENDDSDYMHLPVNQTNFIQGMKEKEKNKGLQSTKIKNKNKTVFRKYIQSCATKLRQFFCRNKYSK